MDDNHWKWGVFYFNPKNRSVFVPKRLGIGWTINFAHPVSWIITLIILGFVIVRVVSKVTN